MNKKLDWNDISIIPEIFTNINSRTEIDIFNNGKLPLFVAPMDTIVDLNNAALFEKNNLNVCLSRGLCHPDINMFRSYGLDEIIEIVKNNKYLHNKVIIDIASAHMKKCFDISKEIKKQYNIELMVGNIANPLTYEKYCEIGVDWMRVGIGGGSACLTSANTSVHYPMASLIIECRKIARSFENPTKIIADGGFKNYSDIIKALALGSDCVMLGGIFNKCIESCGENFIYRNNKYEKISYESAKELYNDSVIIYKKFRGMSTKEVQKSQDRKELRTSEGIITYNKVEYTLEKWLNNFKDYLKSAMSYTNSLDLKSFIGQVNYVEITQEAFNRFNK